MEFEVEAWDVVWAQFMLNLLMTLINYLPENCGSSSKTIKKSVKQNLAHLDNDICIQIIHLIICKIPE